ncbi:GntR family transcriptional regulator [Megasphaera sueciensis]|uniref:GntR family transcriptional regulator n=1 Tax=Megasphaera sueciensis TaxID=349094 RepID=UPI003D06C6CD
MEPVLQDLSHTLSLKDQVYENIKKQIVIGNFKPGSRLIEDNIAKAMNISRAPVREALNHLERDRFVQLVPRKGAYVTQVTQQDIVDNTEMRILMEPYAARYSINDIPECMIQEIEKKLLYVLEHPDDIENYIESDIAVHALFYKYSSNRLLVNVLDNLIDYSLRIRYLPETMKNGVDINVIVIATREHLKIIEMMKLRDGAHLSDLIKKHLQNAEKRTEMSII